MAGSGFGNVFRMTTWGESHGKAVGVVVDGCPAGLFLTEEDVQAFLDRRRPGQSEFATKRGESDTVEILSGVFNGKTTGTPISLMVKNTDSHSGDYETLAKVYRPGHADYTFEQKYGFRDYRGGGRSSGRETVGRVAGGAVAVKLLQEFGVSFLTYTKAIGPVEMDPARFAAEEMGRNPLFMPDAVAAEKAEEYLRRCVKEQDSAGGVIECVVKGLPAGLGETVFDKTDALLAKAMLSIGAVKGFEMGDGFAVARRKGSENNDVFTAAGKGTNHAGGVLGGMTDGSDLIFRVAVKPTPSIGREQETIDCIGKETKIVVGGRHDPVIVPRAVVVVECMAALVLADLLLLNASSTVDKLKRVYRPSSGGTDAHRDEQRK